MDFFSLVLPGNRVLTFRRFTKSTLPKKFKRVLKRTKREDILTEDLLLTFSIVDGITKLSKYTFNGLDENSLIELYRPFIRLLSDKRNNLDSDRSDVLSNFLAMMLEAHKFLSVEEMKHIYFIMYSIKEIVSEIPNELSGTFSVKFTAVEYIDTFLKNFSFGTYALLNKIGKPAFTVIESLFPDEVFSKFNSYFWYTKTHLLKSLGNLNERYAFNDINVISKNISKLMINVHDSGHYATLYSDVFEILFIDMEKQYFTYEHLKLFRRILNKIIDIEGKCGKTKDDSFISVYAISQLMLKLIQTNHMYVVANFYVDLISDIFDRYSSNPKGFYDILLSLYYNYSKNTRPRHFRIISEYFKSAFEYFSDLKKTSEIMGEVYPLSYQFEKISDDLSKLFLIIDKYPNLFDNHVAKSTFLEFMRQYHTVPSEKEIEHMKLVDQGRGSPEGINF